MDPGVLPKVEHRPEQKTNCCCCIDMPTGLLIVVVFEFFNLLGVLGWLGTAAYLTRSARTEAAGNFIYVLSVVYTVATIFIIFRILQ